MYNNDKYELPTNFQAYAQPSQINEVKSVIKTLLACEIN